MKTFNQTVIDQMQAEVPVAAQMPLTENEISNLIRMWMPQGTDWQQTFDFVREIEKAHGIGTTKDRGDK